jgi:hypothetical protein
MYRPKTPAPAQAPVSIGIQPSSLHELRTLFQSAHPLVVLDSVEEERVEELARAAAANAALPFHKWSVAAGLSGDAAERSLAAANHADPVEVVSYLKTAPRGVYHLCDFAPHLDTPVIVRAFREALMACIQVGSTVVLSGPRVELPPEIDHKAIRMQMKLPSRDDLKNLIKVVYADYVSRPGFTFEMRREDWDRLVDALSGMTLNQARQTLAYCLLVDNKLTADDVGVVLERKARLIKDGGLLEYFSPADNKFQLGGFDGLKRWIERAKVGYGDEAKKYNLKPPRGVLLVGVQGCGKSLAAKVIARELGVPLLKLDAGRLYDKYIGETEANFRRATAMAESIAPCVLWIDELEKGFAQGDGGGESATTKRLFGSFLTWLQEKDPRVFVAATANDLMSLPPELQRKGRFDEIFFVDLPTAKEREAILQIHFKLRNVDVMQAGIDVPRLAAASEGFNGAELEQAVVTALYQSLQARTAITTETVANEIAGTVPLSVSRAEDIGALRETFKNRFVPAA